MRNARSFVFLLPFCCLVAAVGCGGKLASPSVPATFTLRPGQTASVQNVAVTFRQVVSDSRCPLNALCVWAGDATVAFTVRTIGQETRHELQLADPGKRTAQVHNFLLEFQELQPYPVAGQPTDTGSYRATMTFR